MIDDWRRINAAVRQESRRLKSAANLEKVLAILPRMIEVCGEGTNNRRAILRIAKILLSSNMTPTILAPSCPDYSHSGGRYDFKGLGGGVSLLARLHIEFLHRIVKVLPEARVVILVADQEADDLELCAACQKTPEEFRALVAQSILKTGQAVTDFGWTAAPMTRAVPGFHESERKAVEAISADFTLEQRLTRETWNRFEMYRRIRQSLTMVEMRQRTIRTAAQYVVLGEYAKSNGALICNHTTTNLAWYNDVAAPLLHNPISVY